MQLAALPRVISICTGSGADQSMAMLSRDPDHNTGLTGRQCHTHQLIVRGIRVLLFYNPAPVRCYSCGNPDPNVTIYTNVSLLLKGLGHGSIHSCHPHI